VLRFRKSALSDHAARQSGIREEKFAKAISLMRSQVLGPFRGTSTGVKNLVSTRFFTLLPFFFPGKCVTIVKDAC
jgi:hypothetical protein